MKKEKRDKKYVSASLPLAQILLVCLKTKMVEEKWEKVWERTERNRTLLSIYLNIYIVEIQGSLDNCRIESQYSLWEDICLIFSQPLGSVSGNIIPWNDNTGDESVLSGGVEKADR